MMVAESMHTTWPLSELLQGLVEVPPQQDILISGLAMDSRQVQPGDLFLACAGQRHHGISFIADAVRAGAVAVVWEPTLEVPECPIVLDARAIPVLSMASLASKAGTIADRFFDHPSQDLLVVGVSGTDGKTSCSHYIAQILSDQSSACGLIGTLGYGTYGRLKAGAHTTPDTVTLHTYLAQFRDEGIKQAVLEVSSHALDQGRINGVGVDIALFTNLGRDHLDYHGDIETYSRAKRRLFEQPGLAAAVLNVDDPFSRELAAVLPDQTQIVAYGLAGLPGWMKDRSDVQWVNGRALQVDAKGICMDVDTSWGAGRLQSSLLGRFNAHNLLGVLGVALTMNIPLPKALKLLQDVRTVPGRMECFGGESGQPTVVVDYAHTPQALEHVLITLRQICRGSLWCVFGAGGERDSGKRPLMGACAERLADQVILTDDNPRRESPQHIVADLLSGISNPEAVWVEHDRATAIRRAVESAAETDVVLVAGKGHEAYQDIGGQRLPFDDRREVTALVSGDPT